ncbi:heterokaryon incompatibility protein-domain-containing protein [Truncatella angustata]|uniref:Heterokaryon incompatibility protein-domain-containing protein n=1 Tax=Truncatella angustata TaxID=152316 RepID=A0A9P8UB60_9PEZI|nr:heterokaryon incompatibility protein-domain-containing protein [Truncatella angustata]KAH6645572.1 heterokaryon incompatibility protein-domain-containing protein [Truncatella angustata]
MSRSVEGALKIDRIAYAYGADYPGYERRNIVFSKCEQEPKHLSSLLEQTQSLDWPASEPYAGRIRPLDIDHRLLKRWKECCMKDHGGTCDQTFMTHRVQSLRFVDVVERCIVQHAPDAVSWAALSYCWGGPQLHALQTTNLRLYQQPGALLDELLPQGIADAMTLTRELGERYLWVDSLCIIQDDDKDKLMYIAAMGTIYARAAVTIVNAANSEVALGVPGVSRPRRAQQVHRMKDFWLVEALDLPHKYYEGYLHNCTWNTRGWTFQEGLLSPRCLIIGRDQVYWQCKTASWCEDSYWENSASNSIYRHYSGSNILQRLTNSTEENWIELYKDVLDAYSKREFTSESDRLGAVQAILQVLRRSDEEGYFWGMPKVHMEMALSWASSPRNTRRDCEGKFMGPGDEILSCPFPTWSWLGWHGPAPMPTVSRAVLGGRLGLMFYSLRRDGTPVVLNENPFTGAERDSSKQDYMKHDDFHDQIGTPRNLAHASIHYDNRLVRREDITPSILSNKRALSVLCFWTSTAVLEMTYQGQNHFHHCPAINLRHGDVNFYSAWEHNEDYKPSGRGKFIVIGTERTRMSHGGNVTLNLLLVEQDASGVSYRSKLVTYTPESVWDQLENRKWELIFLA